MIPSNGLGFEVPAKTGTVLPDAGVTYDLREPLIYEDMEVNAELLEKVISSNGILSSLEK